MKSPLLSLCAPLLGVAALLLAACDGPDRHAMLEEARHSIPPMAAHESYFDGQVLVHLTLAGNTRDVHIAGERIGGDKGKMSGLADINMGEGNFGAGGTGSALGGESSGLTKHGSGSGTYQGNAGMNHINEADESEPEYVRRRRDAEMPPALMRLQLENTSQATVIVQIRDLNSDLGNFAVRPDTVTLLPGQTIETDPMQSKLGVDSFNLPVTISLRAGGQTETKVLTLRPVDPAPSASANPVVPPTK